ARLDDERARADELDRELAAAHPSARASLEKMREASRAEYERGLALLEELSAQLTVLRFAARGPDRLDRERVEHLLAQVSASPAEAGVAAKKVALKSVARSLSTANETAPLPVQKKPPPRTKSRKLIDMGSFEGY